MLSLKKTHSYANVRSPWQFHVPARAEGKGVCGELCGANVAVQLVDADWMVEIY